MVGEELACAAPFGHPCMEPRESWAALAVSERAPGLPVAKATRRPRLRGRGGAAHRGACASRGFARPESCLSACALSRVAGKGAKPPVSIARSLLGNIQHSLSVLCGKITAVVPLGWRGEGCGPGPAAGRVPLPAPNAAGAAGCHVMVQCMRIRSWFCLMERSLASTSHSQ